jgi:hypothetical protein
MNDARAAKPGWSSWRDSPNVVVRATPETAADRVKDYLTNRSAGCPKGIVGTLGRAGRQIRYFGFNHRTGLTQIESHPSVSLQR